MQNASLEHLQREDTSASSTTHPRATRFTFRIGNMVSLLQLVLAVALLCAVHSFHLAPRSAVGSVRSGISMEYIPDGLTKKQWAAIQAEQAEAKAKKGDMTQMGTKRFKSRSFEAWQKAGGKHLFPVNPNDVSYEERPYMQRKNGDWEGSDLADKGLAGKGQGAASKRLKLDNIYDKAKKEGKL
jgi:hypothetical protein